MTKKDYVLIAKVLADSIFYEDRDTLNDVAYNLACEFEKDNPKFDKGRFLKASGVKE